MKKLLLLKLDITLVCIMIKHRRFINSNKNELSLKLYFKIYTSFFAISPASSHGPSGLCELY